MEVDVTDEALGAALLDVRRAYRLVYAYQRRVSDLVQAVADVVRQQDIAFEGWRPVHNAPPPKVGAPFFQPGSWAWDMIPMYAIRCDWADEAVRRGIRRRVLVVVKADTGFRAQGGEPDPSQFADAEASSSRIIVSMMTVRGRGLDWPAADQYVDSQPAANGTRMEFAIGDALYTCIRLDIDMATLAGADSLDAVILSPLRHWGVAVRAGA